MNSELEKKLNIGLTSAEVQEKISAGLVNGELDVKTKSFKQIVKDNLFTLFNLVNLILFICILISGSLKNGLFFLIVIWNFLIGVFQEVRAKQIIEKLSILSAPKAYVLRDGKIETIQVKDILLGDIMQLKNGYQICADAVVLDGECQVNESLITGESTPILKKAGDHLLSGSFLISGKVMAEVEHIGQDNYVNKITLGAKYYKKSTSVIMKSVKTIVKFAAIMIVPMAALLVWKNFFVVAQPFSQAMVAVVAAVSAMIPGGLVLLVSIVLAVSVVRLSMHKALAQDLYCVENLARVDVLCLDKTGTITEGVMKVENIIPLAGHDVSAIETGLKDIALYLQDENSTAQAVRTHFNISMDEVERAKAPDGSVLVPFSSDKKWSMIYLEGQGSIIMGAPEFILGEGAGEFESIISEYTSRAKRVLLYAVSDERPAADGQTLPGHLKPAGFIVIGDRVRADAGATLDYFEDENVNIKVISGDNPVTVSMVAREAGLKGAENYIDASSLTTYEEIEAVVEKYTVFGRVTPYQKLDLIKALKAHGHTVAMTGDGANDVLALKEADCSIAMQSGSEAARNVSNLVLMDSNFASLPLVVAEGRKSINNLQRSASLYLTKTIYAILLAIVFMFVAFAYPFENIQITLIGSFTIGMPSFLLALEPNKNRIRHHFLRNVFINAIPSGVMTAAAIVFTTVYASNVLNASTEQISTIATFTALLAGYIVIFDICGRLNLWKAGLMVLIIGLGAACILVLPGFFSIVPLAFNMYMLVLITAAVFLVIHVILFRVIYPIIEKKNS